MPSIAAAAGLDKRANLARQRCNVVVLHGNSTEPVNRAGGSFCQFNPFVGRLKRFLTVGDEFRFQESTACPGSSAQRRTIPANPNANPQARLWLYQTWARPNMTYPAGAACSGEPLETMTADLRAASSQATVNNRGIAGVVTVGDAFLRAVQEGVAVRNPHLGDPSLIDLWLNRPGFRTPTAGSGVSGRLVSGLDRLPPV